MHAGASVQAILAFLPLEETKKIYTEPFEKFTQNTITDHNKLEKRLQNIRKQGYAISDQEVYIGSFGIAAPIFDRNQDVIASIAVSGLAQRMVKIKDLIIKEVLQVAGSISRSLTI